MDIGGPKRMANSHVEISVRFKNQIAIDYCQDSFLILRSALERGESNFETMPPTLDAVKSTLKGKAIRTSHQSGLRVLCSLSRPFVPPGPDTTNKQMGRLSNPAVLGADGE